MKYNYNANASVYLMWVRFRAVTLFKILEHWFTQKKDSEARGSFFMPLILTIVLTTRTIVRIKSEL